MSATAEHLPFELTELVTAEMSEALSEAGGMAPEQFARVYNRIIKLATTAFCAGEEVSKAQSSQPDIANEGGQL